MRLTATCLAFVAASIGCEKTSSDKIEALEARLEKLEAAQQRLAEVESFVRPIMAQQKQAEQAEARKEPATDVRFAVDVTGNDFDGPEGAAVTIVEVFDFA